MVDWKKWVEYIYPKLDEMAREDLEENAKKAFGSFNKEVVDSPRWDEIDDVVTTLMCDYGPDGHCDGHDVIAYYIVSEFISKVKKDG